jgi:hypothetical protein
MLLPFLPTFFPIKRIVARDIAAELRNDPNAHAALNNFFALAYMVTLVPIIISVPLGTVRAALRIRGLLLNSSLAGWILMVTLPLKVLISLLGLVLASQIVGDSLLILAMAFFLIGPFVYLYSRKLYTDHPAPDWERQVLQDLLY